MFESADTGLGYLDQSALCQLICRHVNQLDMPDEDDVAELINFIDKNGDSVIKREEFVSFFIDSLQPRRKSRMARRFEC